MNYPLTGVEALVDMRVCVCGRPRVEVAKVRGQTFEDFAILCDETGARFGGWTFDGGIPPRDMHPLPLIDEDEFA